MPGRRPRVPGAAVARRRRSALRFRVVWRGALLSAAAFWCVPPVARAQTQDDAAEGARARAEAHIGATRIGGSLAGLFGGTVLVGLGSRMWLGGGGYVSAPVDFADPLRGISQIGMGYGGFSIEVEAVHRHGGIWSLATLVGGGNADATDPVVGVEVGSDNFLVVETVVRFRRLLRGPFGVTGEAGYRWAFAVEDLPGIDNGALSGVTIGFSLYALRN